MASANGHISSSAISGLRHQIIANATSVFPSIVRAHLWAHDLTHAKASEVFDIVITEILEDTGPAGRFNYKAILVYGSLPRRKIAAEGSIRSGMDAAMESLLILLSEFLDPKRVLVPMEAKWKVKEGAVDRSLL